MFCSCGAAHCASCRLSDIFYVRNNWSITVCIFFVIDRERARNIVVNVCTYVCTSFDNFWKKYSLLVLASTESVKYLKASNPLIWTQFHLAYSNIPKEVQYHIKYINDSVECCSKEYTQWYPLCICISVVWSLHIIFVDT